MEKLPLVSIDCITYNHAPYIRQCLEGFLMQKTNFSFEVLVHDDASNDGTADIIREYEIKYPNLIKPIYQTENQWSKGKSISAEYNFPRARGKYIALCEGDDYWTDPFKLQKQVDFLESHTDIGMVYSDFNILRQKDGKLRLSLFTSEPDRFPRIYNSPEEFVLAGGYVCPPSWMFRKECLPKENIVSIDGSFVLFTHFMCTTKVFSMPDVTATYRVIEESATQSKDSEKLYNRRKKLLDLKLLLIDRYNLPQEYKNKCLIKFYQEALPSMLVYDKQKDIERAKEVLQVRTLRDRLLFFFNSCHLNKLLRIYKFFRDKYFR